MEAQQAAVAVAQANIAAQQKLIRVLSQQKDYQSVVAPFDGVITQRTWMSVSLVQTGTHIHVHIDAERRHSHAGLRAAGRGLRGKDGIEAVIRVPEIPDRTFPGKVTPARRALAPGTRTLLTEVDVQNPDGLLRPGMYCTVELHVPRKTPAFIVPADAVIFNRERPPRGGGRDGVARLHKITVARDLGTEIEVRDGVAPGDQVILRPMVNLADGSKVHVEAPPIEVSQK